MANPQRVKSRKIQLIQSTRMNGESSFICVSFCSWRCGMRNNRSDLGYHIRTAGEKFYDFNKIREEIVKDTDAKTGKNAGELHLVTSWRSSSKLFGYTMSYSTDMPLYCHHRSITSSNQLTNLFTKCSHSYTGRSPWSDKGTSGWSTKRYRTSD